MSKPIPDTYSLTGDDPETGAPVIRAQLKAEDLAREVNRMAREGLQNIRVSLTPNPAGTAG